ncbi:glycosyltransferase family 2 protein [Hymenobacter nivis]|uniref:Glycosyltransferase 2-like domain-containing protein n=1 Tax=Hymenobacter nivis TaxID=1850093 RepID=A0A2Z3GJ71_9BACT|nr:glycosyltransferase [Hymenobacter nivis]AWM33843.1 hypothetical protein DDQ68_14220 [Hymenobacter nivis]
MRVSIIVPIYKVEPYVEACIQSIIDQTHKNIELILVNDKTPDASFELAKAVVARNNYNAVFIEHENNSGLSAARNNGLAVATSEFVLFVDSDDMLESTMVAEMSEKAQIPEVDIVVCNMYRVPFNQSRPPKVWAYHTQGLVDSETAVKAVLGFKERMYVWSNLYRKSIFDTIKFVENVYYEDIIIQPMLWKATRKMYFLAKPLYNYFERSGSITTTLGDLNKYVSIPACFSQMEASFFQDPKVSQEIRGDLLLFMHTWVRNLTLTILSAGLPYSQVGRILKKYQEYLKVSNIRRLGFGQNRRLAIFLLILKFSPYLYWKRFSSQLLAPKLGAFKVK